jgi:hypothetical protein
VERAHEAPRQQPAERGECEEGQQLTGQEGVRREVSGEERDGRLLARGDADERELLEREQPAHGAEEGAPVVVHEVVLSRHLDREEHAADGRAERRGNAHGTAGGNHAVHELGRARQLPEERQPQHLERQDAARVHERALLAHGHPCPQCHH